MDEKIIYVAGNLYPLDRDSGAESNVDSLAHLPLAEITVPAEKLPRLIESLGRVASDSYKIEIETLNLDSPDNESTYSLAQDVSGNLEHMAKDIMDAAWLNELEDSTRSLRGIDGYTVEQASANQARHQQRLIVSRLSAYQLTDGELDAISTFDLKQPRRQ